MATAPVSKVFNIEKIQADGLSVVDTLKNVRMQIAEVNKLKVNPFASAVESSNNVRQLEASLGKYIENLAKLKVGVLDVVKAQEVESRTALNNARAKTEEAKARNLNAQAAKNEASAIAISNKQSKESDKALKDYINSVKNGQKELKKLTDDYKKMIDRQSKSTKNDAEKKRLKEEADALKEFNKEQKRLKKEVDDADKALKKQADEADRLRNAYYKLNSEHQKLVKEAQRLGAELGVESKEFKDAAKSANELGNRLLTIDGALGRHQRNVGNYSSAFNGLGNSINQITREFPAFSNSLQTGFLAISNNLPIFFDEISKITSELKEFKLAQEAAAAAAGLQAREAAILGGATDEAADAIGEMAAEQALASAEGVKGKGVLKQLAGALFSWQTLLSVGVTLLTVYGAKIIDFIFNTDKAKKRLEEYEDAVKNASRESQISARKEISTLNLLTAVAQDNTRTLKDRQMAVKELQSQFPYYFANLSKEEIMYGNLSKVIRLATNDLLNQAKAKAYIAKSDLAAEDFVKEEEALREAEKAVAKFYVSFSEIIDKVNKRGAQSNVEETILGNYNNLVKRMDEVRGRVIDAQRAILEAQDKAVRSGIRLGSPEAPEKERVKAITDLTNAEIKANDDILKSNLELLKAEQENYMAQQKFIFDNDKETLQERLNAFVRYNTAKEIIISEEAKMEIEATKNRLAEIAKIEAIAVDKRTPQQQKLLEFKTAFTRQLVVLQKKESLDLQTNIIETQQGITDFIEKEVSLQTKEFQNGWDSQKSIINQRRNEELKLLADSNKTARQQKIERRQIEARYNREIYDAQVDYVQQNLQNLDGIINDPNVTESVRNAAIELRKVLDEELGKVKTPAGDGTDSIKQGILRGLGLDKPSRDDLIRTISDAIKNLYETIFQALDQAREAKYTGILNELDAERDAINRNADLAKAANQSSLKSDEEKSKEEARIETNRLNKESELDAKRKATLRQQAQAEKRDAIFKIELQGAIATARALAGAAENPGLAIAAAALIQAYTQTQMALAQSRPIPEYAEGTMGHIGGKFIAGDGGEHEIIAPPNKAPYISSNKPTLYDEAKGTIVAPFSKLNFPAIGMDNASKAYERLGKGNQFMGMAIAQYLAENETKASGRIVKAIKRQKQTTINVGSDGVNSYTTSRNGTNKSLNRKRGIR